MPELPEVETLRRKLADKLIKAKVNEMTLRRPDLRFPIPKNLKKEIMAQRVVGLRRRSKYLLMDFDNGQTMMLHLGMSGRLFFTDPKRELDKHDHILINFDNGLHLRFRDPRRFGILDLCTTEKINAHKLIYHLGVEPLGDDFNVDYLGRVCKTSRAPIKSILMNASHIVGVGNIYANEALFLSGIRPTRKGCTLRKKEMALLVKSVVKVLKASLASGGTSFRDYVNVDEKPGLHQLDLYVYGREGEGCRQCSARIKRIVQTGRSSFYCPKCQR